MHDRTVPLPPKTQGLVPTCKSTGNKSIDYAGPQVSVACYYCHCYCCCILLRSTKGNSCTIGIYSMWYSLLLGNSDTEMRIPWLESKPLEYMYFLSNCTNNGYLASLS